MGVGAGFWDILKPVAQKEELQNLKGKVVAVDLSWWIVQQETALKGNARKPHLRITFFRAVKLLSKFGILPVFVVDGKAPALKLPVRASRYFGVVNSASVHSENANNAERNALFVHMINECVELLNLMGIPVLRAKGEAEALCAQLNREGLVDACITTDSDAFLHGAKFVIKSFQADCKEPVIECYRASDIDTRLGLKRNHLIAIALLVGCDYNKEGVPGIGLSTAVKIARLFNGDDILNKLREIGRGNTQVFSDVKSCGVEDIELDMDFSTPGKRKHCSVCGHPGNKTDHMKFGCEACKEWYKTESCIKKSESFKCTCNSCRQDRKSKEQQKYASWKTRIINKISAIKGFPNEDIISIFLDLDISSNSDFQNLAESISWKAPKLEQLEEFLGQKLYWAPTYVRQKILPLCSALFLRNLSHRKHERLNGRETDMLLCNRYMPHSIQRVKVRYSQSFYVLKWKYVMSETPEEDWLGLNGGESPQQTRQNLLASKSNNDEIGDETSTIGMEAASESLFIMTDEDRDLVSCAVPKLVESFQHKMEAEREKRMIPKKRRKGTSTPGNQLSITSYFKSSKEIPVPKISEVLNTPGYNVDDHKSKLFDQTKYDIQATPAARTEGTDLLSQSRAWEKDSSSSSWKHNSTSQFESSTCMGKSGISKKVRRCLF